MALDNERALMRFQEYLRMRTDHPAPEAGYIDATALFKTYSVEFGLEFSTVDLVPGHPVCILKWAGSEPLLPSIVLNSHSDVVPVVATSWTKDPWGGNIDDGKVYGRGAQDMKSVTIQHIEAVGRLKVSGFIPRRSIFILIVPDEEQGGVRGMKLLLGHAIFASINPGVVIDEGLASTDDRYSVFYGERKIWWIHVRATGPAGHGSRFVPNTATEKLMRMANSVLAFRAEQAAALETQCGCGKGLGDYTTMNLTMLKAGSLDQHQFNVIPTEAFAGFDCRIPCTVDLAVFRRQLDEWCSADPGVTYELVAGSETGALQHAVSDISEGNFWWKTFGAACDKAEIPLHAPSVFPAATDSRWIRLILGTPCFGFSPIRNTPILLHDHDEHIPVSVFLDGIRAFEAILPNMANAPPE